MKAFIVAALFVASVAAQGIDVYDVMKMKNHHNLRRWNEPLVEDLLLKEKLGLMDYDTTTSSMYNYDSVYGMDFNNVFGDSTYNMRYTIEELVSHPLFREYLRIPLFRKLLEEHPTIFKKYVESPLFQKFWTQPEFQMYFRNPVYFYKYIMPQVQMIATYMTEGVYNTYNYDTTSRYLPYVFGRHMQTRPYTTRYNTLTKPNMKYLLERMMTRMNIKPITETVTDVKVFPTGEIKEQTFGKIVDPITGVEKLTVGDAKTVDERIVPRMDSFDIPMMTSTLSLKMKDALLKHLLINRLLKKNILPSTVYTHLFHDNDEITSIPEIYKMLISNNHITIDDVLKTLVLKQAIHPTIYDVLFGAKRHLFTPRMFENIFDIEGPKKIYTPEILENLFGRRTTVRPEIFEPIFGKTMYEPEVYSTLFGNMVDDDITTPMYKYNPFAYRSKMVNPIVMRMLLNKQKEAELIPSKFLNDMKTEQLIKDTVIPTYETEVMPTVMERKVHRVPLIMGTPIVGSNIDEIIKEKNTLY